VQIFAVTAVAESAFMALVGFLMGLGGLPLARNCLRL